ncbi:MAG: zinc-dependent peptidase [Phycisphaerae bacterium]
MIPLLAIAVAAVLLSVLLIRRAIWRRNRRAMLMGLPPEPDWAPILARNMVYAHLPEPLKRRLAGLMHVFLDEKRFEGCGGLEMTDEIRVTIAAQACVLLLGRTGGVFPQMRSIFVYPGAYVPDKLEMRGALLGDPIPRLGEAWHRGPVVLAWDESSRGLTGRAVVRSPVIHEFAHQLDSEDGPADGMPILPRSSSYADWARVLHREFVRLRRNVTRGRPDVIDAYGAENPAEFFAVVTETFFEHPHALRRQHPELYAQLRGYYNLDPAAWTMPDAAGAAPASAPVSAGRQTAG